MKIRPGQIIWSYIAYTSDECGLGGFEGLIGLFVTEAEAKSAISRKNDVIKKVEVVGLEDGGVRVLGNLSHRLSSKLEFTDVKKILVSRALSKLTQEEQKAIVEAAAQTAVDSEVNFISEYLKQMKT